MRAISRIPTIIRVYSKTNNSTFAISLPTCQKLSPLRRKIKMATTASRLSHPGPIHPAKVDKYAVKPSIARPVRIAVFDPRDHEAPAILHEPRQYTVEDAKASAVILISGAGGGVSGPAGMLYTYFYCLITNLTRITWKIYGS